MHAKKEPMESAEMNVLLLDPKVKLRPRRTASFHVFREPALRIARHASNVFVIVDVHGLPDVSRFVSIVNRRNQLRALILRFEGEATWLPHMMERAHLRTLRNTLVHSGQETPERVLSVWRLGAQRQLIADARAFEDSLLLISCEPVTYEVPFDKIPALKRVPKEERSSFEIADDGSYLHWPASDVHLDLDSIRSVIDPGHRKHSRRMTVLHDRTYGKAIAEYRKRKGLRQADIPGLSERQVRRIETGGRVTSAALASLAKAHGLELRTYLDAIADLVGADPELSALRSELSANAADP